MLLPENAIFPKSTVDNMSFQVIVDPSLVTDSEVYWTFNGRGTYGDRTKMIPTENQTIFRITHIIPKLSSDDAGFYSCNLITSYDRNSVIFGSLRTFETLTYDI